jgi:hypothetical protein
MINQRFNLCKLTKIRSMIVEWIKVMESRLNHSLTCPLKAGLIEYKAGMPTQKAMKEISPMFVTPKDKNNEAFFMIKITFMSKISGKMENLLEYIDNDFKMSEF